MSSTAATGASALEREALWFRVFLFGIAAVGPFSLNLVNPCLPFVREEFGAARAVVQTSASLSILAAAFATIAFGPVSDRAGRKPVLATCLGLYVASGLVCASAPSIGWLVAGRVVQAASSSVALVTARAVIHDVFGDDESTRVIARVSLFAVVAVVFAPVLGGICIEVSTWRSVFGLAAGLGSILFVLCLARMPETATARVTTLAPRPPIRELLVSPVFHGFAVQSSLHFATFFAFSSTATYLMVEVLHRDATAYGLWFVVLSGFVGAGLASAEKVAPRLGAGRLAALGSGLALVGSGLEASVLVTFPLSPEALFLPICVAAFGIGLAVPATNAGVMSVVPNLSGTASGLMGFQQYVFAACFAQLAVQEEARAPFVLSGLCLAGCAFATAFSFLSFRAGGSPGATRLGHDGPRPR